jgi:hypothetical protein
MHYDAPVCDELIAQDMMAAIHLLMEDADGLYRECFRRAEKAAAISN